MELAITDRLLRDLGTLSPSLYKKCAELIQELRAVKTGALRQQARPGWRLHDLRSSDMLSLSVDMNYRLLAQLTGSTLMLHRVVKHDLADRANVNRNTRAQAVATISGAELRPSDIYNALLAFGIEDTDAEDFSACNTEDDLLEALARAPEATANLALTLYETSGLVIPEARFRILQQDDDFALLLDTGGLDWETYLHPSQTFLVELPASVRAAVVGSAGTGKTVCAWHRAKHLIEAGVSLGFVCPHDSVLDVSKTRLLRMVGAHEDGNYFLVPRQPDELVQIAEVADHIIIDEGQEIPVTWLARLAERVNGRGGMTLFYDLNQLGGNIPAGDRTRYRRRVTDWKMMLDSFPRMQKFRLAINYRNAREIAESYLGLLSEALPAKPLADVPVFETGEVVRRRILAQEVDDVVTSLLHRLLQEHSPRDIGIVCLDRGTDRLRRVLLKRKFPVAVDPMCDSLVITTASKIRGHERQVVIVTVNDYDALCRNFGAAIDAYIAMSRAVKRLIVIEAAA